MSEIPEDILKVAQDIADLYGFAGMENDLSQAIACALQAERNRNGWQDIATAPELERVMIAGYQPRNGTCAGYWWWEEGAVHNGKAIDKPSATHWCPVNLPPFPPSPTTPSQQEEAL